ncbi:MAG: glycosyltransferase [Desulfurococcaceae archaeon]
MTDLISIIVSTKNNQATLSHTLSSTLKLTDLFDVELVIVDGKSTDCTPKITRRFIDKYGSHYLKFKVLQDPGTSLSFARSLGYKCSEGSIIIFLDGDTPLTNSFAFHLRKELEYYDLISPLFEVIPLDNATKRFSEFMIVASYFQIVKRAISKPSILPPARIFKRRVLEKMNGYPLLSRFFGEDRIATALAVKLGFHYKFSTKLRLLKIEEPGYFSCWRKHFRYGVGINIDVASLGKRLLRDYIIMRRLNHLNVLIPAVSLIYASRYYGMMREIKMSIYVALTKYFIDLAILSGDIVSLRKKSNNYEK